jgi:predicted MPP superfamily phosphohydrolase
VHAILGNHDWWDDKVVMRRPSGTPLIGHALADAGIPVYENDVRRLNKDGHSFWIAGPGDQWVGVDDTLALMSKVKDDAPLILMVHEPDVFADLDARASLTLAGHMHAGQIRVCGYSPYLPSRFGSRYLYGHIVEQGRHMIVSGGLGCSGLPIRLLWSASIPRRWR